MTIGIDLTLLQSAHRMRGIGYTLINFLNNVPVELRTQNSYVFYYYEEGAEELFSLFDLESYNYDLRAITKDELYDTGVHSRKRLVYGAMNQLKIMRASIFGDSRIKDLKGVDHFIQFNQSQAVPPRRKVKSSLVLYDIIPYVMEADYLWRYSTARARGRTRKNAIKLHVKRRVYYWKTKFVTSKAQKLIAISQHTKNDFVHFIKVKPSKISVSMLGVEKDTKQASKNVAFSRYVETSWGPIQRKTVLPKKYLLYLGGGDQRRKLVDLLAAFNMLRAQGEDISLILAGDIMKGPSVTPIDEHKEYYDSVSYMDDIYFLGFVSDEQRSWLYKNALVCIYPTVYEGFGLPVLEAMSSNCPVITYDNSSIREVAENSVLYASDSLSIVKQVKRLMGDKSLVKKMKQAGIDQSAKFSWEQTSRSIIDGALNG